VLSVDGSNLVGANELELIDQLVGGGLDQRAGVDDVLDGVDPAVGISLSLRGKLVRLAARVHGKRPLLLCGSISLVGRDHRAQAVDGNRANGEVITLNHMSSSDKA
jgi:hypothetical protein